MKKTVILIVLIIFVLSICQITHGSETSKPTEQRIITEFCELFMERSTILQMSDQDYGIKATDLPLVYYDSHNNLQVSTAAGVASLSPDDLAVQELVMTYYDVNGNDPAKDFMTCIMALSALEFNNIDNDDLVRRSSTLGGPATAIDAAMEIVHDSIDPLLTQEVLQDIRENSNEYLVYSGNYDYYMGFYHLETNGHISDQYMLIARAR